MDTSEEYIKMCEKAVDIRELWKPNVGDYSIFSDDNSLRVIHVVNHVETMRKKWIWLPRQDQLQGMLIKVHPITLTQRFKEYTDVLNLKGWVQDCSMEQLWLAFVMKEKFNKTWTGEDWNR